jgi:uncharacterized membrane protein
MQLIAAEMQAVVTGYGELQLRVQATATCTKQGQTPKPSFTTILCIFSTLDGLLGIASASAVSLTSVADFAIAVQ